MLKFEKILEVKMVRKIENEIMKNGKLFRPRENIVIAIGASRTM